MAIGTLTDMSCITTPNISRVNPRQSTPTVVCMHTPKTSYTHLHRPPRRNARGHRRPTAPNAIRGNMRLNARVQPHGQPRKQAREPARRSAPHNTCTCSRAGIFPRPRNISRHGVLTIACDMTRLRSRASMHAKVPVTIRTTARKSLPNGSRAELRKGDHRLASS